MDLEYIDKQNRKMRTYQKTKTFNLVCPYNVVYINIYKYKKKCPKQKRPQKDIMVLQSDLANTF